MPTPRLSVCALILDAHGHALCVSRRNQPTAWGLPGGKIEPGESHQDAVAREVVEETGFVLDPSLLIPLYAHAVQGDKLYWTTTYLYAGPAPAMRTLRAEEGLRLCYQPMQALSDAQTSPFAAYHAQVICALQAFRAGAPFDGDNLVQAQAALEEPACRPREALLEGFCDQDAQAVEFALSTLQAIARRQRLVGDVLEPVKDIRAAGKLAGAAAKRLERTLAELDATHADDLAVNRFAQAVKAKLARSRAKGREGWDDPVRCSDELLARMLVEHLSKGNAGTFEDVGALVMMLHQRGADPVVLQQAARVHAAKSCGDVDVEILTEKLRGAQDEVIRMGNALHDIAQMVGAGKGVSLADDVPRLVREKLIELEARSRPARG